MFEQEVDEIAVNNAKKKYGLEGSVYMNIQECAYVNGFQKGAEFGYNKAKEEIQEQDYSLFDFVMQYEDGKFKCKYKSGKEFESIDGKTWKEIVLPELKESDK